MQIDRSTDIGRALRRRQRGFILNPFVFAAGGGTDPNFANVVLLLHGDGSNGGTTFTDNSSNGFTPFSSSGVTTVTGTKVFGTASMQFTGSSSGLHYSDNAAFNIGAQEFLIECFARFDDTGTIRYICGQSDTAGSNSETAFGIRRNANDKIQGFCRDSSVSVGSIESTSTVTSGQWYYIAYGREGTTFRLFIDAVAEGTSNPGSVTVLNSTRRLALGALGEFGAQLLDGNIDEFRFTVGAYRDVASIGIPSAPFPDS